MSITNSKRRGWCTCINRVVWCNTIRFRVPLSGSVKRQIVARPVWQILLTCWRLNIFYIRILNICQLWYIHDYHLEYTLHTVLDWVVCSDITWTYGTLRKNVLLKSSCWYRYRVYEIKTKQNYHCTK